MANRFLPSIRSKNAARQTIPKMSSRERMTIDPRKLDFNKLYANLFRYIGKNMPIFMRDNLESYVEEAYAENHDVYSIVTYLLKNISNVQMRVEVYRGGEWERDDDHDANELMQSPNPYQSWDDFLERWFGYLLLTGNTYEYKVHLKNRQNAAIPVHRYVMPSHLMRPIFSGNYFNPVGGYELNYDQGLQFSQDEVMHEMLFNPDVRGGANDMVGMSPLKAARRLVTTMNNAVTAQARAFQNMGAEGIISSKPSEFGGKLSETAADAMEEKFEEKIYNPNNFKRIVITGASLEYTPLAVSPVDLNLVEHERISFEQLCNVYHVPARLFRDLSAQSSSNNTYNEHRKQMYIDCIIPLWKRLCSSYTREYGKKYEEPVRFVPDTSNIEVLQEDYATKSKWVHESYSIPFDEKQRMMGVDVDPSMKGVYLIPNNLVPMGGNMSMDEELDPPEEGGKMKPLNPSNMELPKFNDVLSGITKAKKGDLKKGDFCKWNSSGGTARGRVDKIQTSGELDVPGADVTITAEDDDPAVLLTVYQQGEDGWEPSDVQVGHKMSTLTKIDPLKSDAEEDLIIQMMSVLTEGDSLRKSEKMDDEEKEEIFSQYKSSVNMSASELESWAETDCSKKASQDRSPVTRNLKLLKANKGDWTDQMYKDASKTIAFISRMKENLGGSNTVTDDAGNDCGTKAHIALKNWAYDSKK